MRVTELRSKKFLPSWLNVERMREECWRAAKFAKGNRRTTLRKCEMKLKQVRRERTKKSNASQEKLLNKLPHIIEY